MPSLTIIIPTLNSSAFIQQTVRHYHALAQAVHEIDAVIMVDDHSSDDTYDLMVKEKEAGKSPIRIVRLKENYGQLIAYQAGISLAKTDIIIHCDDDVLLSREDLLGYMEAHSRSEATLLYGLVKGKNNYRTGRSTFLWLVKTFILHRLRDKEFSSLCIYDRQKIEMIFRRAWGFHGNIFTPWVFHPHELSHVSLAGGSQVLSHPSRYSLRGYIQHQKFLLLMLCRLKSLALLILLGSLIWSGVLPTNALTLFILIATFGAFLASAALLKIKSELRFEISHK